MDRTETAGADAPAVNTAARSGGSGKNSRAQPAGRSTTPPGTAARPVSREPGPVSAGPALRGGGRV